MLENESLTVKSMTKLIGKNNNLMNNIDEEALKYITNIKALEKELAKIKEELNAMKRKELNRINKEFLLNDYKRRFGISEETIVSAIIGEDLAGTEFLRLMREQKSYYKSVKFCRTYNFLEDTGKKKNRIQEIYYD